MGLFGSSKADNTDSKKTEKKSGGIVLPLTVAGVAAMALEPLVLPIFVVLVIVGERRKIRLSRWWLATGVGTIIALAASGLNFSRLGSWFLSAPAALWGSRIPDSLDVPVLPTIAAMSSDTSTALLWLQHCLVAAPTALFGMSLWWWWRSYALQILGENEGAKYSNRRPVGWLDRRRIKRNEIAVRSGDWSQKNPGGIALGIGTYGDVASTVVDDVKKAVAVVGTSRSGKTRLANSIAAQQVHEMQGGHITICYKGADDVARAKAELAHEMGVPFLHFKLMPPTGGGYKAPHPYAPNRPAHYDPFQHGNGASKAAMLLNSVPRDGDAAVYERKASEAVKLAYDIAALTGFDKQKTETGAPVSGLAVLARLLDPDTLVKMGLSVTVEQVRGAHPYLSQAAAESKVGAIHSRIEAFKIELGRSSSTLSGALEDVRSTVASYVNDSAAGSFLSPGSIPSLRIDLVRAILRNEIIVFSLPAQEYPEMASMIGTMVLLDLQNAVATLRDKRNIIAERYDNEGEQRPGGPDGTPWNPLVVQLEEIGSVKSTAAAEAMLGLFNKSADVGIRPILSTQSLSDIEAVDGSGVWLRQLTAQLDHLITFQLSESHDSEKVAAFSGMVEKKLPTESNSVENNRTGLFRSATAVNDLRSQPQELNRIPVGEALGLDRSLGQLLWVSKVPKLSAVHTTGKEGPNNWFEALQIAPVYEKPQDWNPFDDADMVAQYREDRDDSFKALLKDLEEDAVLHQVLDDDEESVDIEQGVITPKPSSLTPIPAPQEPSTPHDPMPVDSAAEFHPTDEDIPAHLDSHDDPYSDPYGGSTIETFDDGKDNDLW